MAKSDQPLLAAKFPDPYNPDLSLLKYPLYMSPKLDGIRCRIDPNLGAISRTAKRLPNNYIQQEFNMFLKELQYLDGEIFVGSATASDVFNRSQSGVMTEGGKPDFSYHVFDYWANKLEPFSKRILTTAGLVRRLESLIHYLKFVKHEVATSINDLEQFEQEQLSAGYEGVMLRSPEGIYKNGRSTMREGYLIKLKRWEDAEATIVGFEPLERNNNPAVADIFGHAKRSSHKSGKVADELLGTLLVRHETFGDFGIGSGFDVDTRVQIWTEKERYLGRRVTFKFQKVGLKEKPRFPIFKGVRED